MIIGFSGLARSGKSTCSRFLRERGWIEIGFADPIKRTLGEWLKFSDAQLWGNERDRPDCRYKRADGKCLTARHALQQLGTEFGRACYPNLWVDLALDTATTLLRNGQTAISYDPKIGLRRSDRVDSISGICFADVRFLNEVNAIQQSGGKVIRLKRGMPTRWQLLRETVIGPRRHESEFQQLMIPDSLFDHVIDNRSMSLDDLRFVLEAYVAGQTPSGG
jgi:hypothetical protein